MKRIAILLPDGVGIRNYLYAQILDKIKEKTCEVVLIHNLSNEAILEVEKLHDLKFKQFKFPSYKESFKEKFLRELICLTRLNYNISITKNESLQDNWNPSKKNWKLKIFYSIIEKYAQLIGVDYKKIEALEKKYSEVVGRKAIANIPFLENLKIDLLFSVHQRAIPAVPIVLAAKKMGIKTVGAIYSWDNIPKARLAVRTDFYLVWSKHMKKELELFYPEIPSETVTITGTPQFEFYYDKSLLIDKKEFCQKYDLDPEKKTICFSGDDARTSPYDQYYLKDLAEVISLMPKENQFQILFRRCPVDLSGRYDAIIKKYSSIIKEAPPLWNFDKDNVMNWTLIYPKFEDVALLVNTVTHTDVVINVGSTMAHDFAMLGKPAIYINYDQQNSSGWSSNTLYQFQHFKSMGDLSPVFWWNKKSEINDILGEIVFCGETCNEIITDSKQWLDKIASNKETASERIVNALIE